MTNKMFYLKDSSLHFIPLKMTERMCIILSKAMPIN